MPSPAKTSKDAARPVPFDLLQLQPVPRAFYLRNPRSVARDLLGKLLIRREHGHLTAGRIVLAGRIVETEAYLGTNDPAAHSAAGPTDRNRVLFGPPGHAYVYFIYGNHFCLNVSCQPEGQSGGVLFRALEPVAGIGHMLRARALPVRPNPTPAELRLISSGPGRLTQAFGITRLRDNGIDLAASDSSLFIAEDGFRPRRIVRTPRIGISKATASLLRYVIGGNAFVSGKRSM